MSSKNPFDILSNDTKQNQNNIKNVNINYPKSKVKVKKNKSKDHRSISPPKSNSPRIAKEDGFEVVKTKRSKDKKFEDMNINNNINMKKESKDQQQQQWEKNMDVNNSFENNEMTIQNGITDNNYELNLNKINSVSTNDSELYYVNDKFISRLTGYSCTISEGLNNEKHEHLEQLLGYKIQYEASPNIREKDSQKCFNCQPTQQKRRRPEYIKQGIWSQKPVMCDYDPTKCPNGEKCAFCHGKDELIQHPLIFKTKQCTSNLDEFNICKKFGRHCAKAHTEQDLRKPMRPVLTGNINRIVNETNMQNELLKNEKSMSNMSNIKQIPNSLKEIKKDDNKINQQNNKKQNSKFAFAEQNNDIKLKNNQSNLGQSQIYANVYSSLNKTNVDDQDKSLEKLSDFMKQVTNIKENISVSMGNDNINREKIEDYLNDLFKLYLREIGENKNLKKELDTSKQTAETYLNLWQLKGDPQKESKDNQ